MNEKLLKDKRGSNIIYIVVLIGVLSILGIALASLVSYNTNAAVINRNREQAYQIARSVQQKLVNSFLIDEGGIRSGFEELAKSDSGRVYSSNGETVLDAANEAIVETHIEYNLSGKSATIKTTGHYKGQKYTTYTELVGQSDGYSSSAITSGITGNFETDGVVNVLLPDGKPGNVIVGDDFDMEGIGKDIIGNIIAPTGDVELKNGSNTITGNVTVGGEVSLSGSIQTVYGNITAIGNVELENGSQNVTGAIISRGSVELKGDAQKVGGGIICDGNVYILNGGKRLDGGISSKGNIIMGGSGSVINGDVYCLGDFQIASGSVINGNVYVGGKIYQQYGGSPIINGTVRAGNAEFKDTLLKKGIYVVGDINLDYGYNSHSDQQILPDENGIVISAGGNIVASQRVGYLTKDNTKCATIRNGGSTAVWNNNSDAMTREKLDGYLSLMPVVRDSDFSLLDLKVPEVNGSETIPEYNISGEADAVPLSAGDIYHTLAVSGRTRLEPSMIEDLVLEIKSGKRVFIFMQGTGTVILDGIYGDVDTADKLFLVSNPQNNDKVTISLAHNTKFYGQMYLPKGVITLQARNARAYIYGMTTASRIIVERTSELNLVQYPGDYSGTGLDSTGGTGNGNNIYGSDTSNPSSVKWEVLKHYVKE